MKKLLVLAAVSAMAMGAQAEYTYTVNLDGMQTAWDLGTMNAEDLKDEIVGGYFNTLMLDTWANQYKEIESSWRDLKFSGKDGEFSIVKDTSRDEWALVFTDAEGIIPGANYSIYLATSTQGGGGITLGELVASGTFNTDSPTPAPEPTSGLLLLLGVAGLALKRKRA